MSLFHFGKKDEPKAPTCCSIPQAKASGSCCCGGCPADVTRIQVLGSGCKSCHELYENAKQAAEDLGLSLEVEYVTDLQKAMEYGVMRMPALVVNEKVVSMGQVLKSKEIVQLLREQ